MEQLRKYLNQIDGKGYKAYKDITGQYSYQNFRLNIDHVQGDPFAAPSRVSVRMPMATAGFAEKLWMQTGSSIRKIALEDYLGRVIKRNIKKYTKGKRGSGGSGEFDIEVSGQQVIRRNAVIVSHDAIEVRLVMGLPANGRRVAGQQAQLMFFEELPKVILQSLVFAELNNDALVRHLDSVEDQEALRQWLDERRLVAFIANGSILPRSSGIDDRPLTQSQGALAFTAPESMSFEVNLPNSGIVKGLGIQEGVTLIVGGGFHGKSTLLHALERGPYNHLSGDGREKVVTLDSAVKIRAEDGRVISKVNISPFIDRLPFDRDTNAFTTENASGSTSQAANIIEAIESGTRLLLIDEDTSATNFMIRDERMQKLVTNDKEPITPLLHRVRELYESYAVSSIIVMGGSGDYFDVADQVILMDCYAPFDVTAQARALANRSKKPAESASLPRFNAKCRRMPNANVLSPTRAGKDSKIDCKGRKKLHYGEHHIDLSLVEQLVDIGQTRSIGLIIYYYACHYAAQDDLITGLTKSLEMINQKGLDIISPYKVGNLALPRLYEVAAAVNRIREGDWKLQFD